MIIKQTRGKLSLSTDSKDEFKRVSKLFDNSDNSKGEADKVKVLSIANKFNEVLKGVK